MPRYIDGMCTGDYHRHCTGSVLVSTNMDHTKQHIVDCECQCHTGGKPAPIEVQVKLPSKSYEKAVRFADKMKLKGKARELFLKEAEKIK